jgi:hypothetical protein
MAASGLIGGVAGREMTSKLEAIWREEEDCYHHHAEQCWHKWTKYAFFIFLYFLLSSSFFFFRLFSSFIKNITRTCALHTACKTNFWKTVLSNLLSSQPLFLVLVSAALKIVMQTAATQVGKVVFCCSTLCLLSLTDWLTDWLTHRNKSSSVFLLPELNT